MFCYLLILNYLVIYFYLFILILSSDELSIDSGSQKSETKINKKKSIWEKIVKTLNSTIWIYIIYKLKKKLNLKPNEIIKSRGT